MPGAASATTPLFRHSLTFTTRHLSPEEIQDGGQLTVHIKLQPNISVSREKCRNIDTQNSKDLIKIARSQNTKITYYGELSVIR